MSAAERIAALERVIDSLLERREIVNILIWEICKNVAEAEFDRTITFTKAMIEAFKEDANSTDADSQRGIRCAGRQ